MKRRSLCVCTVVFLLLARAVTASAQENIVAQVRVALSQGDLARADSLVSFYQRLNGYTPEVIEAFSWLGRAELSAGQVDRALDNAEETRSLVADQLKTRKLAPD